MSTYAETRSRWATGKFEFLNCRFSLTSGTVFFFRVYSAKPSKIYQYEKIFWIFKIFKCNFGEDRVEKKEKVACKKWKFHRGAFKNGTFTEMYILLGTWVPTLMKISFFDSFLNSTIKFQIFPGGCRPQPPATFTLPRPTFSGEFSKKDELYYKKCARSARFFLRVIPEWIRKSGRGTTSLRKKKHWSGQNKIRLCDFDHWTKVRLRRD